MCEVIDESYNASPVTVAAAIRNLQNINPGPSGRRIAVLGDMLELGNQSGALHAGLAEDVTRNGVDLVFLAGAEMAALAAALDPAQVAATAPTSEALLPAVVNAVRAGDTVMVKGALGSRMAPLVAALKTLDTTAPRRAANGR